MLNGLEYILKLKDQFSSDILKAAGVADNSAVRIQRDMDKMSGSSRNFKYSLNDLKAKLDAVNATRMSTHTIDVFKNATREAKNLEMQIDRMEGKSNKIGGGGGGFGLGSLVKGNLISGAITNAMSTLREFGSDIYSKTLSNAALKTAINSTTGGQGKEAVGQTASIANKYGLNYEASLEGIKTLTGGLKGMNMPLKEQMQIFEGVSTGIAAMKLTAEQSKGAMLALGQMASKGTVSAEELRGQLGERIPGAFSIAAKAMNVTEAELGKMMQQGEIAAKDFLPRFAAEMQKTFGADALAAANGPQAMQERFNNAIYNMKTSIGDGLMPLITPLVEKFTYLATVAMPYIQTAIEFITGTVRELWSNVSGVSFQTGEWGAYFEVIKNHVAAVWITIKSLAGNIWSIVKGVIEWLGKSELVKDLAWAIGKYFEAVLWIIRKIGDAIQWVWQNIIKPIVDAVEWVYKKVKGLFGGGKTTVEIVDGTKQAVASNPYTVPVDPITLNATNGAPGIKTPTDNSTAKGKADSINAGGQRSIVININKQVGAENIHVMSGAEAANNIESLVREAMRRTLLSLNGNAVANAGV